MALYIIQVTHNHDLTYKLLHIQSLTGATE